MKTETDEIIMIAAQQAAEWQKIIRNAELFREFVEQGKLEFLRENVFLPMEKDILSMIRKLDFVPSSLAQLGHIKGQLETLDGIESRIMGRINEARDAAQKLNDLSNSTPTNGNE